MDSTTVISANVQHLIGKGTYKKVYQASIVPKSELTPQNVSFPNKYEAGEKVIAHVLLLHKMPKTVNNRTVTVERIDKEGILKTLSEIIFQNQFAALHLAPQIYAIKLVTHEYKSHTIDLPINATISMLLNALQTKNVPIMKLIHIFILEKRCDEDIMHLIGTNQITPLRLILLTNQLITTLINNNYCFLDFKPSNTCPVYDNTNKLKILGLDFDKQFILKITDLVNNSQIPLDTIKEHIHTYMLTQFSIILIKELKSAIFAQNYLTELETQLPKPKIDQMLQFFFNFGCNSKYNPINLLYYYCSIDSDFTAYKCDNVDLPKLKQKIDFYLFGGPDLKPMQPFISKSLPNKNKSKNTNTRKNKKIATL